MEIFGILAAGLAFPIGNVERDSRPSDRVKAFRGTPFPKICAPLLFPEMACPSRKNGKDRA